MAKRKKRGRPPKPSSRVAFVGLRVSRAELRELKRKAKAAGMSLSEYILKPHR